MDTVRLATPEGRTLVWTHAARAVRLRADTAPQQPDFDEYFDAGLPWVHFVPGADKTAWLGDARAQDAGQWALSGAGY